MMDLPEALRDRFAREGVTEIVEWEEGEEVALMARNGPCLHCGRALRTRYRWVLEGDQIRGEVSWQCPPEAVRAPD